MPSSPKIVALDTSFLIRLLVKSVELHSEANDYFDTLLERECILAVPVIAIGEYVVKGNRDEIPFQKIRILPYNLEEAILAGHFARPLFEARQSGTLLVNQRTIIPNDVKIFATAETAKVDAILTADEESSKIYSILKNAGLVSFDWVHIGIPANVYLGELGLK